jgi:hypothetical protein
MKRINFKSIEKYFNVQKIAALFFVLLILSAYHITIGQNNPFETQKQKIVNMVKNQQDKGISTLAITSLPFWLALTDKLTNEDP